jgi:tetratricopeptide (TPR) repeat protein
VRAQAEAIVKEMAGLPLALEQAGAYLDETGFGLSGYLTLYQQHRADLLKHKGRLSPEYPHTVATTWSLAFQQVEQANTSAANLLRLCAFLDPDSIPESMIADGASALGAKLKPVAANPFKLNEAIQVLLSYSLVKRDPTAKTLSIHRLVQAVLKDGMEPKTRRQWTERTVRAVEAAFPEVEFATWPRCREFLPHALACAELIEQLNFTFVEAADLLYRVGWYLDEHARYAEAEPLLQRALNIFEQALGPEHPNTAATLHALARLSDKQGKYAEAEPLYKRALHIREQALGPEHPDTATTLHELARLYLEQGKYAEAEPLFQRALHIYEQALGPEHPQTAATLHELARLYHNQGKYAEAEPLYQRALRIKEQVLMPEHPSILITLKSYASLLRQMHRTKEAEKLEARVREIEAMSDSL